VREREDLDVDAGLLDVRADEESRTAPADVELHPAIAATAASTAVDTWAARQ
jgi:hypothetical protein